MKPLIESKTIMLMYQNFHLKFGNKNTSKLLSPRIFELSKLELPKQTAYHYFGLNDNDVGPNEKNPLISKVKIRIPLYSYMDIETRLGTLQIKSANPVVELKKHIKNNRKFILCLDLVKQRPNPIVPLFLNYALVNRRYKYLGNPVRADYYKEMNVVNTVLKGIVDTYNSHNGYYNQFLFVNVPDKLHPVSFMKRAATNMQLEQYAGLNNLDSIWVFEFWKWLGNRREASVFKNMPKKLLDKLNVVFISNNRFTVYNLGLLDNWRKSTENPNGSIDPLQMSKQYMRMLINLQLSNKDESLVESVDEVKNDNVNSLTEIDKKHSLDTRGTEEIEDIKEEGELVEREELEESTDTEVTDIDIPEYSEESDDLNVDKELDLVTTLLDEEDDEIDSRELLNSLKETQVSKVVSNKNDLEQEAEFDETFEDKLNVEDVLNLKKYPIENTVVLVNRPKEPKRFEDKAKAVLDEYAKNNSMTVSKYDGIRKGLTKYKSIKINNGAKMTLGEMVDIKPEDVAITEKDTKGISTLMAFDKKYINEVMDRDAVSMLTAVQSAGVVVMDMKQKQHEDIGGAYTVYSMKVKPIEGEASTIRVRIPKVDEEGQFKISGNSYTLRRQRRDLPIRKISPDTVSLTSYFGKTFARRDESRGFSLDKWLATELRKAAFDKENTYVVDTRSANVFDNTITVPYTYSILSKTFRAITTKECFLYFDYNKAEKRFGSDVFRKVESRQLTFCGLYKNKFPIGMDDDNVLYYIDPTDESIMLGTVEEICGLNTSKMPVESVSIDIMGKSIPIGLVLSYKLGMTKLLASLKPKHYRTIPSNKRLNLEDHEYAIRFSDFNLILSRKDRMTSLIFSGLQKCDETQKHSIYLMDSKEIYFNLLESIKIPGRYLKEIDLYYRMFVDPITERILIEMNEPTDFGGLLIRCVEMLTNLKHKDEVDMTEQRIAGYERMTGEIYTQMVRALREHNRHGIKANYPIEMNPEAVWMAINKDTTKSIVESLNPIQELKQQEVTTFSGNGGRSSQSMVKRTRKHDKSAIGIISEASVDSSDAGVTTYLSSNPKFTSLYGIPENSGTEEMNKDLNAGNVLSTAVNMSPCADTDDKQNTFIAQ